jgi:hypothetical protein
MIVATEVLVTVVQARGIKRLKRIETKQDAFVHSSFLVTVLLERDDSKCFKWFNDQFKSLIGNANT